MDDLSHQLAVRRAFDGPQPRALSTNGVIIGLTARVSLTPPTPSAASATTTACGSPLVLADDGVYQWSTSGWRKVPGLTGAFAGGALLRAGNVAYAFDRFGSTWSVPLPACPADGSH